ncbi:hypothetical protein CPC08DRAFT_716824 [Agrocybe pediades]|nr:hypothetical protein CPC08DRAFT_716824 [Agrocybe pediades]
MQCGLDHFQKHYAPFEIPEQQVSAILLKLLDEHRGVCAKEEEGKGVFQAFNKPLPITEADAYRPLEQIANAIAKAASDVLADFASTRELNYVFRCCSQTRLNSDISGSDHLVHGVFEKSCPCNGQRPEVSRTKAAIVGHIPVSNQANPDSKCHIMNTRDVASIFEFKLKGTQEDDLDNQENVVSANVQIMNEDPRRMFTYGLTVEGYEMTLWYFCRSHSVMAGKIHLNSPDDFRRLVTTFVSFMFATPEEMGYDPTITVHLAGDKTQYTYKIPGVKAEPKGSKDRFFRTVASIDDHWSSNITGRMTRVWKVREMQSAEDDALPVGDGTVHYVLKDVWRDSAAPTEREIQNQIFTDIVKFLSNISLSDSNLAKLLPLQEKHALQLMHCAGWVHRDISSGNILAYEVGPGGNRRSRWQAKLSDLEYAKRFYPRGEDKDGESKDPKTGTPYFMPHEILTSQYLSAPVPKSSSEDSKEKEKEKLKEYQAQRGNGMATVQTQESTVVHNPQHDVESLWWLKLWILTFCVNHPESREWAGLVFRNSLNPSKKRRGAFTSNIDRLLSDKLRPDLVEPFAFSMGRFGRRLREEYIGREQADEVLDLNACGKVYEIADEFFTDIKESSAWREVPLLKGRKDEPVNAKKRSRPTSNLPDPSCPSASRKRSRGPSKAFDAVLKPSKRAKACIDSCHASHRAT